MTTTHRRSSGRKTKAESRHDFLKTAGKLAVHTLPAMMLSTKAGRVSVTLRFAPDDAMRALQIEPGKVIEILEA